MDYNGINLCYIANKYLATMGLHAHTDMHKSIIDVLKYSLYLGDILLTTLQYSPIKKFDSLFN